MNHCGLGEGWFAKQVRPSTASREGVFLTTKLPLRQDKPVGGGAGSGVFLTSKLAIRPDEPFGVGAGSGFGCWVRTVLASVNHCGLGGGWFAVPRPLRARGVRSSFCQRATEIDPLASI